MNPTTIQEVHLLFSVEMDTSTIKKVFDQLQSSLYQPKLEPYHLYNFRDIQRNSKSSQEGNDEFETWMLVVGEKRESFDYGLFF